MRSRNADPTRRARLRLCPVCGADRAQPCRGLAGHPWWAVHLERARLVDADDERARLEERRRMLEHVAPVQLRILDLDHYGREVAP
jgi:hypothetical protein